MDFKDLIKKRKSIRKFEDKKLERALIEEALDMVIQSPTAKNMQNRTYTVITDEKRLEDLARVVGDELGLKSYNFMGAPALVLVSTPEDFNRSSQDAAIALTYLYLAATDLGLGACWINQFYGLKSKAYQDLLDEMGIKGRVQAGMVLGYPGEDPKEKAKDETVNFIG